MSGCKRWKTVCGFQSFPTKLNRVSNILKKGLLRFAKANPQKTPLKINGWNLAKSSEPNLHDCVFHVNFTSRCGSKRACSTGCVSERKKVSSTSELTKRAKPPPVPETWYWGWRKSWFFTVLGSKGILIYSSTYIIDNTLLCILLYIVQHIVSICINI